MKNLMKYFIAILAAVAMIGSVAEAGNYVALIPSPNALTNISISTGANPATNSLGVYTNNYVLGTVAATATNTYNLVVNPSSQGNIGGLQPNTNWFPSAAVSLQGNYPNTLYGPSRMENFVFSSALVTGSGGNIAYVFAGSQDGVIWVTNLYTFVSTNTGVPFMTNLDTGAMPLIALQNIQNTNATAATNIAIELSGKPGL